MSSEYTIQLKDDTVPFALSTLRRIPIPLRPKVKEELQRMERFNIISRIETPTDFVHRDGGSP